eukprot:jgi/Mesen1/8038/ME000428S07243
MRRGWTNQLRNRRRVFVGLFAGLGSFLLIRGAWLVAMTRTGEDAGANLVRCSAQEEAQAETGRWAGRLGGYLRRDASLLQEDDEVDDTFSEGTEALLGAGQAAGERAAGKGGNGEPPCVFSTPPPPAGIKRRTYPLPCPTCYPCPVCYMSVAGAARAQPPRQHPSAEVLKELTYVTSDDPREQQAAREGLPPRFGGHISLADRAAAFHVRARMTVHCGSGYIGAGRYAQAAAAAAAPGLLGVGQVISLAGRTAMGSRKNVIWRKSVTKHLLHRLFPNVQFSIWLDAKLQLTVDPFRTYVIAEHYERKNVFDEAEANKVGARYDNASIDAQMAAYARDGLTPYSEAKLPLTSATPPRSYGNNAFTAPILDPETQLSHSSASACGFLGPGYTISEEDRRDMHSCHGIVVASAIFGAPPRPAPPRPAHPPTCLPACPPTCLPPARPPTRAPAGALAAQL